MASDSFQMDIVPASVNVEEVQALLMTEMMQDNKQNMNIISIINACEWSITIRIFCDDLDSEDQVLNYGEMCKLRFTTSIPEETLVFCQTKGIRRSLNFDAWGGTSPRGFNVWTLTADEGVSLNGTFRKSWNMQEPIGFAEENKLSEEEYFRLQDSRERQLPSDDLMNGRSSRNFQLAPPARGQDSSFVF